VRKQQSAISKQLMRPGVVRFALAYDQWTTGVSDIVIYAFTVKDEKQRSNGVHANAVMWTDT